MSYQADPDKTTVMRKRSRTRDEWDLAERRALRRREMVVLALVALMMTGAWIVTLSL